MENLVNRFVEVLGAKHVKTKETDLSVFAYDASPFESVMPLCVVSPKNAQEVSAILKLCNEHRVPVIPRGSGSNLAAGTVPTGKEIVLDMKRMDKILEIDEANLTAWVEPAVITFDLANAVEAKGLMYPPDPGSIRISTIGGNIAENSGGLRGLKYGVTRDYVLGLEVVLPNGEIIYTGGKVAKDVAGYNLTQLMVGSEGTLGVVTKALLKLIPKPECKKTISVYFNDLGAAGDSVSEIINNKIIPVTLEIMDRVTVKAIENFAKLSLKTDKEALLLIEQDGNEIQVEKEIKKIIEICEKNGGEVSIAKSADEALQLASARRNALAALASLAPTTLLEDATVPRSKVGQFLREIQRISKDHEVDIYTFGHAGDGNMHPTAPCDIRDKEHYAKVEKAFDEIFRVAVDLGGTITGEHGVGKLKIPYLSMKVGTAGVLAMKAIKNGLDPNNILNPSVIFSEGM